MTSMRRMSRFLSYVLRHRPDRIGLTLDSHGWVMVDDLLAALAAHKRPLSREQLTEIVQSNDKQRFAFSADGQRIRANQGHSLPVDLALPPTRPPDTLYHGTAVRHLPAIQQQGLRKRARHHVHLSPDAQTATAVGQRHGEPVVLLVDAQQMAAAGHLFYQTANGVWLTDHVPPAFICFPQNQSASQR